MKTKVDDIVYTFILTVAPTVETDKDPLAQTIYIMRDGNLSR